MTSTPSTPIQAETPGHDLPAQLTAPLPEGWLRRFRTGFSFPFRGLGFLKREPMLLPLAIMPAVLNLGLAVVGLAVAFMNADDLAGWLWQRPESVDFWSGTLSVLWVVLAVLLALVMGTLWLVVVYALAGLLATPFTDYLTEQVERRVLGLADEEFQLARFLRDVSWSILHSGLNLAAWVLIMAPMLLLNLLPGVGNVAFTIISGAATSLFLAREMHDGCMTRRRLSWWRKQQLIMEHGALMAGFGCGTMVLFWLPGLNLVMLPVAHVGGALLYSRLALHGHVPRDRAG